MVWSALHVAVATTTTPTLPRSHPRPWSGAERSDTRSNPYGGQATCLGVNTVTSTESGPASIAIHNGRCLAPTGLWIPAFARMTLRREMCWFVSCARWLRVQHSALKLRRSSSRPQTRPEADSRSKAELYRGPCGVGADTRNEHHSYITHLPLGEGVAAGDGRGHVGELIISTLNHRSIPCAIDRFSTSGMDPRFCEDDSVGGVALSKPAEKKGSSGVHELSHDNRSLAPFIVLAAHPLC